MFPLDETITPERGAVLCDLYGIHSIAKEIRNSPEKFQNFHFNGSKYPMNIVYDAILPHRLQYEYGKIGTSDKEKADNRLLRDLLNSGHGIICSYWSFIKFKLFGFIKFGSSRKINSSFSKPKKEHRSNSLETNDYSEPLFSDAVHTSFDQFNSLDDMV